MTILMDIPENSMFLYGAPNEGWTPELVANWLSKHASAQAYTDMYAQIYNLVDIIRVNYEDGTCAQEDFCEWDEFLTCFSGRMIALQQSLGLAPEGSGLSLAKALAPIMNAHGYQNDSGWWVSMREDEDFQN